MEEKIISLEVAILAKKKGFKEPARNFYRVEADGDKYPIGMLNNGDHPPRDPDDWNIVGPLASAPTQSLLQRWIREKHNILITIYSNASGFLWEMHKTVGGTHLFDSVYTGPNDSGCWDSYEAALENALEVALKNIPPAPFVRGD